MLQPLYAALIRLHPPGFRGRFGDEMRSIFDEMPPVARPAAVADAAVSLARQWLLRPEFRVSRQAAPVARLAGAPAMFGTTASGLHPSRWIGGATFALLSFWAASLALGPAAGLAAVLASLDTRRPSAAVDLRAAYFHCLPFVRALDANGDIVISRDEIAAAPAALRSIDVNGDGALSGRECGGSSAWPGAGAVFMSFHPVLNALDVNHDGVISAGEIANAAAALATLDTNHDGRLSSSEVLP